jgi:hypothetical protein
MVDGPLTEFGISLKATGQSATFGDTLEAISVGGLSGAGFRTELRRVARSAVLPIGRARVGRGGRFGLGRY